LFEVPDPYGVQQALNPCLNATIFVDAPVLVRASCLARQFDTVLVFHMGSVVWCNSTSAGADATCPADGMDWRRRRRRRSIGFGIE
jgi:hypothetical protein